MNPLDYQDWQMVNEEIYQDDLDTQVKVITYAHDGRRELVLAQETLRRGNVHYFVLDSKSVIFKRIADRYVSGFSYITRSGDIEAFLNAYERYTYWSQVERETRPCIETIVSTVVNHDGSDVVGYDDNYVDSGMRHQYAIFLMRMHRRHMQNLLSYVNIQLNGTGATS